MTLEQILEEVRTLTPEEQRQVRAALENEGSATNGRATNEDELRREGLFEQRLRAAGLLEEVPPDENEELAVAPEDWEPIVVEGEPVSETIMRERR